jgi:C4-dicarboxylate transporter DctQ subunit
MLAEDIPLPRWLLGIILPIGFTLLALRLLEQGWAILTGRAKGFELADEAADALELARAEQRPGAHEAVTGGTIQR